MNKVWACVILALAGALVFAVGAIELPSHSFKDGTFDLLLGLIFVSIALAVSWAPA